MQIRANGNELEMALDDGGSVSVLPYTSPDGHAGDLADGETFTTHDGCIVTRRGGEAIWTTPPGRR